MSLEDVVKIDLNFDVPTYHLYDELFKIGVTQVMEKWHDLLEPELILEGEFTDEDIAWCFYRHSPMMYAMKGSMKVTIDAGNGHTYTTRFTRV